MDFFVAIDGIPEGAPSQEGAKNEGSGEDLGFFAELESNLKEGGSPEDRIQDPSDDSADDGDSEGDLFQDPVPDPSAFTESPLLLTIPAVGADAAPNPAGSEEVSRSTGAVDFRPASTASGPTAASAEVAKRIFGQTLGGPIQEPSPDSDPRSKIEIAERQAANGLAGLAKGVGPDVDAAVGKAFPGGIVVPETEEGVVVPRAVTGRTVQNQDAISKQPGPIPNLPTIDGNPVPPQATPESGQKGGIVPRFAGDEDVATRDRGSSRDSASGDSASSSNRGGLPSSGVQSTAAEASAGAVRFSELVQMAPEVRPGQSAEAGRPMAPANPPTLRGVDPDDLLSQVVQQARLVKDSAGSTLEIRLKPEFLGKIKIETSLDANQQVVARLLVQNPEVRTMLESRLVWLTEQLGESGLRVLSVQVEPMAADGSGGRSSQNPNQETAHRSGEEKERSPRQGEVREEVEDAQRRRASNKRLSMMA